MMNCKDDPEVKAALQASLRRIRAMDTARHANRQIGEAALRRLLPIAQRDTGQSKRVAHILLGLYNGYRFPLNLTTLRGLDDDIVEDVLAVFRMDANAYQEVHLYFDNGGNVFEQLAKDWGFDEASDA